KSYQAQLRIKVKDIDPLIPLLGVDVKLSPNILVEGSFTSGRTTIFQAYTRFDTLKVHNSMFANNEIELSASKMSDSTNVLAIASMRSENQALGPHLKTHDLLAEGVWNNSYINFGLDADQVNQTNNVRVKGIVDFLADSTTIRMEPSSLRLLEREWSFKRDNFIKIKNNG